MKICPALIALAISVSIASGEESTFNEILSRQTVKKIVSQVVVGMAKSREGYQTVVVEPPLYDEVAHLAGETKLTIPMDRSEAEKRLKDGVFVFFHDFREFVAKQGLKVQLLVLRLSQLHDFLGKLKAENRCGKIPCPIPPCCGDCDGCEGKTGALTR